MSSSPFPKFGWFLVALSPAALIMVTINARGGQFTTVLFGVNGLLSLVGCYGLVAGPGRDRIVTAAGALMLAIVFFALNLFLGLLGGCALGANHV